ncbi:MAG: PAS domain S-box protein [Candidatus Binatia bacterium]
MPTLKKTSPKSPPRRSAKKARQTDTIDYRSFFEHAREGLFRSAPEDHFTEVNPALVRMLGYDSPEEVLALTVSEDVYADPYERERLRRQFEPTGLLEGQEAVWKKKNGEHFTVSLSAQSVKDSRGRVVAYEGMVTDLTAQKRVEGNLYDVEKRFGALMESTQAATFVYQGAKFLYVNPATEILSGYSAAELKDMNFWEIVHPDSRQMVRERGFARLRGEKVPARYEVKIVTKNGEERWMDLSAGTVELEGKSAVVGTAFDITTRKQTEIELERGRELFQRFMDSSPICAYIKDEEGRYSYLNKACVQYFPGIMGKTDADCFPSAVAKTFRENDLATLASGGVMKFEETNEEGGGARHWTSFKFPIVSSSGKKFVAGLSLDVTKQKKLEEQLRDSEERYRAISEITSDYAYAFRVEPGEALTLEWITAAFSRTSGLTVEEVMVGEGWIDLCHPEDKEIVQRHKESVLSGQEQTCEFRIIAKSGEVRWLRNSMRPVWDREQGRVVRIYGAGQDITERKRLEEQLRERVIQPKDLGANLRRFRQQLGLTQSIFGQAFGGYSQRQITSYETGEIEIPMGLLLSIRNKGYPLEVVLGESQTDALDKIVGYLSTSWKIHETAKRLTESILRLLDRESASINSIMTQLGVTPEEDISRETYTLRDMLRRAGIESSPAPSSEEETVK